MTDAHRAASAGSAGAGAGAGAAAAAVASSANKRAGGAATRVCTGISSWAAAWQAA
jgi:hypothetical protein